MVLTDMVGFRTMAESYMTTPCTLVRPGRADVLAMARYLPNKSTLALSTGSPLDALEVYRWHFPQGTDVARGDTVVLADTSTWRLYLPFVPRTYQFDEQYLGVQITDAAGNPVYLRPNATVTVTRQDGTPAINGTNRAVRIVDSKATMERLMPFGEVGDRVLLDVLDADYRPSDIVTVITFGTSSTPIGFVDYVVNAQPVPNSASGVEWLEVWLRGHHNAPNG